MSIDISSEELVEYVDELDTASDVTLLSIIAASAIQHAKRVGRIQASQDILELALDMNPKGTMQ